MWTCGNPSGSPDPTKIKSGGAQSAPPQPVEKVFFDRLQGFKNIENVFKTY